MNEVFKDSFSDILHRSYTSFLSDLPIPEVQLGNRLSLLCYYCRCSTNCIENQYCIYLYKHILFHSHFAVLNLVSVKVFNMTHSSYRIVVPFASWRLMALRDINPKSSDAGRGPQPKGWSISPCCSLSSGLKSGWLISFQFLYSCISSLPKHGHHSLPLFQQWLLFQVYRLHYYAVIIAIIVSWISAVLLSKSTSHFLNTKADGDPDTKKGQGSSKPEENFILHFYAPLWFLCIQ